MGRTLSDQNIKNESTVIMLATSPKTPRAWLGEVQSCIPVHSAGNRPRFMWDIKGVFDGDFQQGVATGSGGGIGASWHLSLGLKIVGIPMHTFMSI